MILLHAMFLEKIESHIEILLLHSLAGNTLLFNCMFSHYDNQLVSLHHA